MSERCLHCAIIATISDHADAQAPAGEESRVDVVDAMFCLGAVFRNLMSLVPADRQAEAAQAFASGTNQPPTGFGAAARTH